LGKSAEFESHHRNYRNNLWGKIENLDELLELLRTSMYSPISVNQGMGWSSQRNFAIMASFWHHKWE